MKKVLKVILLIPVAALFLLVLAGVCFHLWETRIFVPSGKGAWESTSPDGRHTVAGYVLKGLGVLVPTMPGDGSSGPGIVLLRDNKTGEVLQKERVDSVISLGVVLWEDTCKDYFHKEYKRCVYVQDVATWELPPREGSVKYWADDL